MKCKATKEDGEQCNANAMNGSDFCYTHNPDISDEEKKEAQARGGQNRALMIDNPLPEIPVAKADDVVLLLADTVNQVRTGKMNVKIANCLGTLSGQLIKALELAKYADKLDLLEGLLKKRKR